jgi:thiol-disulfide isomerase/thioredoxin
VENIGNCLKEHGFQDAVVKVQEEYVHIVGEDLKIKKTLTVKHLVGCQLEVAFNAAQFNNSVKQFTEGISNVEVSVTPQIAAGDKYQTIHDILPLGKTDKVSLEHKEGEVWLLDFWATWCPHNQDMLERRSNDWGSNVRIIGLSID